MELLIKKNCLLWMSRVAEQKVRTAWTRCSNAKNSKEGLHFKIYMLKSQFLLLKLLCYPYYIFSPGSFYFNWKIEQTRDHQRKVGYFYGGPKKNSFLPPGKCSKILKWWAFVFAPYSFSKIPIPKRFSSLPFLKSHHIFSHSLSSFSISLTILNFCFVYVK